jgi:sulfoxide reductase heme-binding subunit YedZ
MIAAFDPFDYSWWLAARAAGIVAIVLVSASVGLGLAMSVAQPRRPGLKVVLRRLHQYVAVGGLVAIASHGLFLLLDPWLSAGVVGILVPFTMDYRPLWTGLGIVAGWSVMVLGLSYWARNRIGASRWKVVHRFTLLAYVLSVVHVLGAGTDASSPWLRAVLLAAAAPIPYFLVLRLWPAARPAPGSPSRASRA